MRIGSEVEAGDAQKRGRRAKCLAAAAAAVPLLVLPAVGTATDADASAAEAPVFDALPPGPTRALTLSLIAGGNDDDLRGVVCEAPRTCMAVPYPYLDRAAGVVELDNALRRSDAPDHQIIYGYSQGSNVAGDWLNKYAGTEDALPSSALSLVLIGNPGRKYGGSRVALGEMTPDSEYNVLDVSRQYDLSSDVPDDKGNLLAMLNAYMGFSSVHPDYEDVDIYDPANYVWKDGNTTYVFVPTERLPMLGFLYSIGLTGFADSLDAVLRPQIEKAYDRSYLPAEPGWPPAELESEPEPEDQSADPEQPAVAALAMAQSASADEGTSAAAPVQDDADLQDESESGAEGAEANAELGDDATLLGEPEDEGGEEPGDLDVDDTDSGDLDDAVLEAEVAEDQDSSVAAAASEDSDSPESSSTTDSASPDSDASSGSGTSDSADSADDSE